MDWLDETGLLVIVGAGASYDSLPQLPVTPQLEKDRPPLTDQLFTREEFLAIADTYRDCNAIVPYLTHLGSATVEEMLTELQREAEGPHGAQRIRQLAAVQYYLQNIIWSCSENWFRRSHGVTAFRTLIDQIQYWQASARQRAVVVTFNYDTLLEKSLVDVGLTFPDLDSYVARPNIWLIKAHGSVSWGRVTAVHQDLNANEGPIAAQQKLIERLGEGLKLTDDYIHISGPADYEVAGTTVVPSVAIPVRSTKVFACPQNHIEKLKTTLPRVHHVLSIGWRGSEAHFVDLLRNGLTHTANWLIVSDEKGGEDTRRNLVDAATPG